MRIKDQTNRINNLTNHLRALEKKQKRIDNHLQDNPTDYENIVLKIATNSDIIRTSRGIKICENNIKLIKAINKYEREQKENDKKGKK